MSTDTNVQAIENQGNDDFDSTIQDDWLKNDVDQDVLEQVKKIDADNTEDSETETIGAQVNVDCLNGDQYNAQGNVLVDKRQTFYQIINAHPIMQPDLSKSYHLEDPLQCAALVQERKIGLHLSYACMLALLDAVPLNDAVWLTQGLLDRLPKVGNDEEQVRATAQDTCTALDTILASIHAQRGMLDVQTQIGKMSVECISFPSAEYADSVLINIWNQVPGFRSHWIDWLFWAMEAGERYVWQQATRALVKIFHIDFHYGYHYVLNQLLAEERYLYPTANVFASLLQEEERQISAEKLLAPVMDYRHSWRWKIPVLLYIWRIPGRYFDNMHELVKNKIERIYAGDRNGRNGLRFIGEKLILSEGIRDAVCEALNGLFVQRRADKSKVIVLFFTLLMDSRKILWRKNPTLPLLACDHMRQLGLLEPIYQAISNNREHWRAWCWIVRQYILQLDQWGGLGKKVMRFFAWLAFSGDTQMRRVTDFLQEETLKNCEVAEKILEGIQHLQRQS